MDLKTSYMGLALKNPLVASSSPLTRKLDNFKALEDAGASAIVMHSLFEEQIHHSASALNYLDEWKKQHEGDPFAEAPEAGDYVDILTRAREAVDVPIIASLNGASTEGWTHYAQIVERAGASAIELNVYYIPSDASETGSEVEQRHLNILSAVRSSVKVPVSIKLSPFFSAFANIAVRLDRSGADGLVLFNRFYQPEFNLDRMQVVPTLELSAAYEARLPLMWIAMLYGQLRGSLAATTGVHSGKEVAKYILAGADAVMTASAILKNSIGFIDQILNETVDVMEQIGFDSVEDMKGSLSQQAVQDPSAFRRANYLRTIESLSSTYTQS